MKVGADRFKGEAPRIAPERLPAGMAQDAVNARLLSGDLEAWNDLLDVLDPPKVGEIVTIYLLANLYWLHWVTSELGAGQVEVDVVAGAVPGDTTYRRYLTGLDVPRVTNLALATTGGSGGAYPYATIKLGVPIPTTAPVAALSVSGLTLAVLSDGSTLDGWVASPEVAAPFSKVEVDAASPMATPPSFKLSATYGAGATIKRDLIDIGIYSEIKLSLRAEPDTNIYVEWAGTEEARPLFAQFTSSGNLFIYSQDAGAILFETMSADGFVHDDTDFEVTITQQLSVDRAAYTVRVTQGAYDSGALAFEVLSQPTGNWIAVAAFADSDLVGTVAVWLDDVEFKAIGTSGQFEAVRYAYTWSNLLLEEGGPSPLSNLIYRPIDQGVTVNVTAIADPDPGAGDIADYGLAAPGTKKLYRAASGTGTTDALFVDTVAYADTTYDDTKEVDELGDPIETEVYDIPPADGHSIVAMPNGITLMASKNQLCQSEIDRPHAYDSLKRKTTDSTIVTIAAIDTTAVILTEAHPYIASGNDPAALGMSKSEYPYGCSSKKSVAYLQGLGVAYSSPDGLVSIANLSPRIVTEQLFSRKEWQALNPSSIIGVAHDDRYIGFYRVSDDDKAGFILDPRGDGFGLVWLDIYAQAAFSEPLSDTLYLVVDNEIVQWEGAAGLRPYRWKSSKRLLPKAMSLAYAMVRADNYTSLTINFYGDGALFYTKVVTSRDAFPLPSELAGAQLSYSAIEFELIGTAPVKDVQIVDDPKEFR